MPIAYQYNPELVIVAAGFDSADGETAGCHVTPAGFGHLTNMLMTLANGRLALLLEGGYGLKSIADSMAGCVRAMLRDPLPAPNYRRNADARPLPGAVAAIRKTIQHQMPYWSVLRYHDDDQTRPEAHPDAPKPELTDQEFKFMIEFCLLPGSDQVI